MSMIHRHAFQLGVISDLGLSSHFCSFIIAENFRKLSFRDVAISSILLQTHNNQSYLNVNIS